MDFRHVAAFGQRGAEIAVGIRRIGPALQRLAELGGGLASYRP